MRDGCSSDSATDCNPTEQAGSMQRSLSAPHHSTARLRTQLTPPPPPQLEQGADAARSCVARAPLDARPRWLPLRPPLESDQRRVLLSVCDQPPPAHSLWPLPSACSLQLPLSSECR